MGEILSFAYLGPALCQISVGYISFGFVIFVYPPRFSEGKFWRSALFWGFLNFFDEHYFGIHAI